MKLKNRKNKFHTPTTNKYLTSECLRISVTFMNVGTIMCFLKSYLPSKSRHKDFFFFNSVQNSSLSSVRLTPTFSLKGRLTRDSKERERTAGSVWQVETESPVSSGTQPPSSSKSYHLPLKHPSLDILFFS